MAVWGISSGDNIEASAQGLFCTGEMPCLSLLQMVATAVVAFAVFALVYVTKSVEAVAAPIAAVRHLRYGWALIEAVAHCFLPFGCELSVAQLVHTSWQPHVWGSSSSSRLSFSTHHTDTNSVNDLVSWHMGQITS